ncbi:putative MYND domain protein [Dactylonectria macrodidyma]|uniref:MYND domain protein n=1 Tax=Dactylonectria macrodidyma TaxID=307937 RepID=A0A9P9EPI4_9HYPO|nr:putative MYND domain protein [Dactylonectria macrodidyma]
MPLSCSVCKKTSGEASIKKCAKCSDTPYCSRECQKADWKAHKKICGKMNTQPGRSSGSKPAFSPPKGLKQGVSCPFTRLDKNTWLHNRPETDVYTLLIDSYRLRVQDDYVMEGGADADSIYGGASNGLVGFKRYLKAVESRRGLLPEWWGPDKAQVCQDLGMDKSQWCDLSCKVEKSDIIEQYGDAQFPMQLRMFTEAVLGRGPGGSNGAPMRGVMMAMEQGNLPDGWAMSIMDNTTGNVTYHES